MKTKILVIALSFSIFCLVLELIRREKLTFKYALLWLGMSLLALLLAILDNFILKLAKLFGFVLPSNFIFFIMGVVFILVSLLLTVYLCQQSSRNELISQKIGILAMEVKELKKKEAKKEE